MIDRLFQHEKNFCFDGKSSLDFFCIASQGTIFPIAEKDFTTTSVAGRYGDLYTGNDRFTNVDIDLECFIAGDNFFRYYHNLMAWLMSREGYKDLYFGAEPEYIRKAYFKGGTEPTVTKNGGSFTLVFSCDPRRFLSDSRGIERVNWSIFNHTLFDAKPALYVATAAQGQTIKINDTVITFRENIKEGTDADTMLCIDSETMSCTQAGINKNSAVGFNEDAVDVFPVLHPGKNIITTDLTVYVQKNLWTV